MLVVNRKISIPLREIEYTFSRSGGPGGQNVNKVNTKVQLRWNVEKSPHLPESIKKRFLEKYKRRMTKHGEVIVSSQRFRDQGRNVADATSKLREMIESVAKPPKKRKPTKVPKRAKKRRLEEKRKQSEKKQLRRPID